MATVVGLKVTPMSDTELTEAFHGTMRAWAWPDSIRRLLGHLMQQKVPRSFAALPLESAFLSTLTSSDWNYTHPRPAPYLAAHIGVRYGDGSYGVVYFKLQSAGEEGQTPLLPFHMEVFVDSCDQTGLMPPKGGHREEGTIEALDAPIHSLAKALQLARSPLRYSSLVSTPGTRLPYRPLLERAKLCAGWPTYDD